jgi:manganese transport protein
VHESVSTQNKKSIFKKLAFFGPAYLISVGYMDPDWATDLGRKSIWVFPFVGLLMSNLMALLLQSLSAIGNCNAT